jgi:branched-subunit amino acid aminotransferase/4-amino-4-deoxychorismate lyase
MAGFEGIKWAGRQMRYMLADRKFELLDPDSKVSAVSRSTHYGLCLAFEGIRFFARRGGDGGLEVNFLNLDHNLQRFRRGIAFNLGSHQQEMVPSAETLIDVFVHRFFASPEMRAFLLEMAELGAQGYLRPFTLDEEQSIGVTFPGKPAIRAVVCRYDRYLGEPFRGVVVPNLVRAVGANGTGCLKLGVNYLMSVKAVEAAKRIQPEAASALFLDDQLHLPLRDRNITEWDSSCCLFALRDGTVIKIPESNLILPSVTIAGITVILRHMGVNVEERDMTYGELIRRTEAREVVAICSVGTAGVLNRAETLLLVDEAGKTIAVQEADSSHPLHAKLGEARDMYWDIYQEKVPSLPGLSLDKFVVAAKDTHVTS